MSDTTNTVVTGIQNVAVSSAAPTDGYVLTYVGANSDWEPKPHPGLRKDYFTSNGSWVCPAGVTNILVIGCGAGGGGGGGNADGAGGGGAAIQSTVYVGVTPGNSYSITIGVGGAGGAGSSAGNDGSDTIFGSNLAVFTGASGAAEALTQNPGVSVRDTEYPNNISAYSHFSQPGMGGFGGLYGSYLADDGVCNLVGGFVGGAGGAQVTGHGGGGGGAAGPQGNGGSGGNASTGVGTSGSNASTNTGAGGGGGGGGTGTTTGGNGGSGYLYIVY